MSIYRSAAGRDRVRELARELLERLPLEHATVELPTRLGPTHVLTAGDGAPLVLLPGTNFTSAASSELIVQLARTHRVHAVDLPGQPGLSHDVRPDRPRIAYGEWLTELLPSLCDTPPLLVGHSLGAHVVLSALEQGADAAGAVLIDPAGLMRLSATPTVLQPTLRWLVRPSRDTAMSLLQMMMAAGQTPSDDLIDWMLLVGRHVRTSLAPRALPVGSLRVALTQVPAVTIVGRHDVFLPPERLTRAVQRRIPMVPLRIAEHAGHLVPHERPDAVVRAISEHIPS